MNRDAFQKSLANLQRMAKGQLFHTASSSEPGTWSGSATTEESGHEDGIEDNGTDYDGVKKSLAAKVAASKALTPAEVKIVKGLSPYKLIAAKVSKGLALTRAESWAAALSKSQRRIFKSEEVKGPSGGADKVSPSDTEPAGEQDGADEVPPTNAGSDAEDKEIEHEAKKGFPFEKEDDEEEHDDAEKSLARAVAKTAHLSKGIDMSPMLAEFVEAFGHALKGQTASVQKSFIAAVAPLAGRIAKIEKALEGQDDFNKSLASTVVGIGQHLAGSAEQAASESTLPAGGPRSQVRAQGTGNVIEKSFAGPGGLDVGSDALAKSQLVNAMFEMVQKGQLQAQDVIKFESTGEIRPDVHQKVQAFISKSRG